MKEPSNALYTCKGVRSSTCPPYDKSDVGSGRCRISPSTFSLWGVRIGWVVKLQLLSVEMDNEVLDFERKEIKTVLCTVWPDNNMSLESNMICIDDACVVTDYGDSHTKQRVALRDWINCFCRVLSVFPPKICSSIHVSTPTTDDIPKSITTGIPVTPGCSILIPSIKSNHKNGLKHVFVSNTNPGQISVTSPMTFIVRDKDTTRLPPPPPSTSTSFSSASFSSPHPNILSTNVVDDMTRRAVIPSLVGCDGNVKVHGILLMGPSGAGKTFSVHAIKNLISPWCHARVEEINIPAILSDDNPLGSLRAIFQRAITSIGMKSTSNLMSPSKSLKTGTEGESSTSPIGAMTPNPSPSPSHKKPPGMIMYTPNSQSHRSSKIDASSTTSSPSWMKETSKSPSDLLSPNNQIFVNGTPPSCSTYPSMSLTGPSSSMHESSTPSRHSAISAVEKEICFVVIDEIDALGRPGSHSEAQTAIKQCICDWLDTVLPTVSLGVCVVATTNRAEDVDPVFRRGGRLEHEIDFIASKENRATILKDLIHKVFVGPSEGSSTIASCNNAASSMDTSKVCDENSSGLDASNETYDSRSSRQQAMQQRDVEMIAEMIAEQTGGYVAADLTALITETAKLKHSLRGETLNKENSSVFIHINSKETTLQASGLDSTTANGEARPDSIMSPWAMDIYSSIMRCMSLVEPSCLRGVVAKFPKLNFEDVIGNQEVKRCLTRILSFTSPAMRHKIQRFGLKPPGGALLYGPPGNSKTRLVMAATSQYGLPMISLSAADVYSPYVGDAEAEIRKAFRIARQASPCVLFIDEIDALVTDRGAGSGGESGSVESRVLATLLTEMDGVSGGSDGVIVIGATNRLDSIDAALLRKGRFHQVLEVPLPSPSERIQLVNYFGLKCSLSLQDIEEVALQTKDGMSGADVENLCRERAMARLRNKMKI